MEEVKKTRTVRWPFLVAGLAALAVAITGSASDGWIAVWEVAGGSVATVTYLFGENAFLTTYTVLGLALLVSTILPRTAARAIGSVAAIAYGSICALFMYHTYQVTGSPFGFFPWVPLALTALLSAFAVWRA